MSAIRGSSWYDSLTLERSWNLLCPLMHIVGSLGIADSLFNAVPTNCQHLLRTLFHLMVSAMIHLHRDEK